MLRSSSFQHKLERLGDSALSPAYDSRFARAPGMPAQLAMGEERGVGTLEEEGGEGVKCLQTS